MNSCLTRFDLQKGIRLLSVLIVALAACTPSPAPTAPATATPEPVQLKIGVQPFIGFAPLFIAQEAGYFTQQGLKVEFVTLNSSDEALPPLMQGQLDLLLTAVTPGLFNAIAGGSNARTVLGGSRLRPEGCAPTGVVARRADAARLRDTANWKGLTLSTSPSGSPGISGFWLSHALAQGGLTLADVNVVKLPPASGAEALQSGSVDLVEMTEPWITRAVAQANAVMVVAAQDVVPDRQLSVIVFGPRLLRDANLGGRVALAYLEGLRQYQSGNTDRNVAILAQYTKLDTTLVKQICWPAILADGSVNLDSLAEFQAWAVTQGYMDKVVDKTAFWDGRFLDQAQRGLAGQSK